MDNRKALTTFGIKTKDNKKKGKWKQKQTKYTTQYRQLKEEQHQPEQK
jgi:hypothetical protein